MSTQSTEKTPLLRVNIRSRNKTFYNGPAYSVTSINEIGNFDVLPQHANFVTLVMKSIVVDKGLNTEIEIPIDKGVLYVQNDAVDGYIGV